MEKKQFEIINKQLNEGEIIPFYILKNYLEYKIKNIEDKEKFIKFYRINNEISYDYLLNIDINNNYDNYRKRFSELMFSLSEKELNKASLLLNNNDYNNYKEFISNNSNKMFLKIFNELKKIVNSKDENSLKRKQINELISHLNEIYKGINDSIIYPTLIANINYNYNKQLYDFIYYLKNFLKKRNSNDILEEDNKKNDKNEEDIENSKEEDKKKKNNKQDISNKKEDDKEEDNKKGDEDSLLAEKPKKFQTEKIKIINKEILNIKTKRTNFDYVSQGKDIEKKDKLNNNNNSDDSISEDIEESNSSENKDSKNNNYIDYNDDEEFLDMYLSVIDFLEIFQNVFQKISNNKEDAENILRLEIILYYLNSIEENRDNFSLSILEEISNVLMTSTVSDAILEKYDIFDKSNNKIDKESWKSIKINEEVNIKIEKEIIKNIRIKYFNSTILNLESNRLKKVLNSYSEKYLSINGLRKKKNSIIFINSETEEFVKNSLFNLLSSNIIKEGYEKYEPRFDHSTYKYPFQGIYKREIFDEIWDNIIVIPFLYKTECARTERTNYRIFLDSEPNNQNTIFNSVNSLFSKENDLYHEIFHIITILYVANQKDIETDSYSTVDFMNDTKKGEIKKILEQNIQKYAEEISINPELDDLGDIMEIYLYGIKPGIIFLYQSLFISSILINNTIDEMKIEEFRNKNCELTKSQKKYKKEDIKKNTDNFGLLNDDFIRYFKESKIWDIFSQKFKPAKIITNTKYQRCSASVNNNVIINTVYYYNRRSCFPRRDKKY